MLDCGDGPAILLTVRTDEVEHHKGEISFPGGGNEKDAQRAVPEDVARYPEQFFFGVLPAWGAYIRHARNIEFKNVVLETRSSDERKRIVLDDVEGFSER